MMPKQPVRDLMKRTLFNLKYVETHKDDNGPYEITQLVNSFLAGLAHPWERYQQDLNKLSIDDAVRSGWPLLEKECEGDSEPQSLGELIGFVRHSFAHGNVEFLSDNGDSITRIRFWNNNPRKDNVRIWGTVTTIDDMRTFLSKFVELAQSDQFGQVDRRGV